MKILIDIGHPAHIHYFKFLIKRLLKKENEVFIVARDKEVAYKLLDNLKLPYHRRGKGANSMIGKLLYLIKTDILLSFYVHKLNPDVLIGFASPYIAHVSKLFAKTNFIFDDTEHANLNHTLYKNYASVILTPTTFKKDMGKNHIRFNSYMELCYLHPNHFNEKSVIEIEELKNIKNYIVIRFVSWNANHDIGQKGFSLKEKINIVMELSKIHKVFISSESILPKELEKFKLNISPDLIHSVLSNATLFIGEGATMASECAMLGTPAIYVNSLSVGYLEEQQKYGLVYCYRNPEGVLEKALELLGNPKLKDEALANQQRMLADKIDATSFMEWFIENYPESLKVMKENPEYQYNFR